ncbi:acetylserotonin O-methyltransferase [Mycolicibacterium sp. P9-64]|uniref:acetylserotonin O-methyltransferase n=1 Tax=Mycolicibacterium sp. P9-64 TaxID=2024612 RepID=UPI001F5BF69D|nr:acetylserotonin O-methyltransferase [Mycolicibacterium sp. P9-64]
MPNSRKAPPVPLIRAVDRVRTGLQTLTRKLVPGNIALLEIANGSWTTQALYVAAKLGIPDELVGGPLSAAEVARRVGADPDAVHRLMRALAGKGVFELRRDGTFALTSVGDAMRADAPGSIRGMILLVGDPSHWEHWGNLLHSVKTGETAPMKLRGTNFFEYLDTNPELAVVFNDAMTSMSAMAIDPVLATYDFSGFAEIVDVGGGHGSLLAAVLQSAPNATGVLFDLPSVVEGAPAVLDAVGVGDRCTVSAGSFMDAVPDGGDAYLLKTIIHDWDEETALLILRNVRAAMGPAAKLLLLEMVLPEHDPAHFGTMLDLEMLVIAGGKERTRSEYSNLLARAGFRLERVVETAGPLSIVEAQTA